jgi:hypothetical protein
VDSACDAPCWREIVPGETEIDVVAAMIRADRQNVEISVTTLQNGNDAVSWKTFDSELNDSNFIVAGADGTVEAISLLDIADFGLGDVIAVQGEPDYALAIPNDAESALFYAIYVEKSLIVLGFITAETGLSEETAVVGAQYFSPVAMADVLNQGELAVWTGYDGLEAYISR